MLICDAVAILPKQIRLKTDKGSSVFHKHDQSRIISKRPNPYQNATSFWREFVFNMLHEGNGLAWMEGSDSDTGRPVAYWNVKSAEPLLSNGRLFIKVHGALPHGKKFDKPLPIEQFIHVPNKVLSIPGVWGAPTWRFAAASVELGKAAEYSSAGYLREYGSMYRYITTSENIPKERREQLQKQLLSYGPGGELEGKTPLLDMGMEIKDLQLGLKDVDALGSRSRSVEETSRFFSMPAMHKLGHLERMNFANAYQAAMEFREVTVLPIVEPIIDELNHKALRPSEVESGKVFVHFETKKMLESDPNTRMEFYRGMAQLGALSANTALAIEDMDNIGPEGDNTYIMANMIPTKLAYGYWEAIISRAKTDMTPDEARKILLSQFNTNGSKIHDS
jgi:HK97 family phage portal protein